MTWQPGRPVLSSSDRVDWQAWRMARKLELQRERRQRHPRIDYYPCEEVRGAIEAARAAHPYPNGPGSDNSNLIDALILCGFRNKLETSRKDRQR